METEEGRMRCVTLGVLAVKEDKDCEMRSIRANFISGLGGGAGTCWYDNHPHRNMLWVLATARKYRARWVRAIPRADNNADGHRLVDLPHLLLRQNLLLRPHLQQVNLDKALWL